MVCCCVTFVLLRMDVATGYKTIITIVFTAAAGNTTVANNAANGPGRPTIKAAEPKKTMPEMTVPTAVKIATEMIDLLNLLNARNKAKNINDVTNLSIILGNKPPGKVVVKPEIIPVARPRSKTLFLSGNKTIPKNIIVNIISGFMPRKNPGTTAWSTVPIPTNRARATRFFVFNSNLSSSKLS